MVSISGLMITSESKIEYCSRLNSSINDSRVVVLFCDCCNLFFNFSCSVERFLVVIGSFLFLVAILITSVIDLGSAERRFVFLNKSSICEEASSIDETNLVISFFLEFGFSISNKIFRFLDDVFNEEILCFMVSSNEFILKK